MKFLRAVKECSLRDHLRNDDIRKDPKLQSVLDRIKEYRQNWKSHVERMLIPKQAFEYRAVGTRDRGRHWEKMVKRLWEVGTDFSPCHVVE